MRSQMCLLPQSGPVSVEFHELTSDLSTLLDILLDLGIIDDPCVVYGAFISKLPIHPPPHSSPDPPPLPLHGLTFAVKDIGHVTGFGNPDWARTHEPATLTAPVVTTLLEAGATCVGKTVMDEMAYSINGENKHYGTPTNPCVPDLVPGGSSSGSAVAVAAGIVDFALGTDTGGSIRVPAAYCGIFGLRPSHDVVSTSNVIPMAQSFDTVGWFARDPATLAQVGRVLLPLPIDMNIRPTHICIPEDCFQFLGSLSDQVSQILTNSVENIFGSGIINHENIGNYIYDRVPNLINFISESSNNQPSTVMVLAALSSAMRLLQRFEFKANHQLWLNTTKPNLGPGISEKIAEALLTTEENIDCCKTVKRELRASMTSLLEGYGVLAIPTLPGPPPKLNTDTAPLEDFRAKSFSLLSIAGMSGFCQISIPLGIHNDVPVSVSLVAIHGSDHFLLNLAHALYDTLKEQACIAWKLAK